jgi:hypothetical protein
MGYHYGYCKPLILVTPDAIEVRRGESLGYTVEGTNCTGDDQEFEYWSDLYLWTGNPWNGNPVDEPVGVRLRAGAARAVHFSHTIPKNTPLETFTQYVHIGSYPYYIWDEDSFAFTVVK